MCPVHQLGIQVVATPASGSTHKMYILSIVDACKSTLLCFAFLSSPQSSKLMNKQEPFVVYYKRTIRLCVIYEIQVGNCHYSILVCCKIYNK